MRRFYRENDHFIQKVYSSLYLDKKLILERKNCNWVLIGEQYHKRKSLYEHIKDKHGIELFHLEDEVKNQIDRFQKPLVITEATIEPSINLLHKVLVEGVNIPELRNLYELYVDKTPKGYKDWKSIKLYQGILEGSISDDELKEVISPMYLLNDFRQYFDHLLSNEKKESIKANILSSLQVKSFDQIKEIYDLILKRLAILYEYLSIAVEKSDDN